MPTPRTTSNASSASFFKKSAPFRPPGPAKRATSGDALRDSSGHSGDTAPAKPATMTISDDEEEFGTAFDLEDMDMEDLADSPPNPAPQNVPTTAAAPSERPRPVPASRMEDDDGGIEGIPPQLLTRIMHESYKDKNTKISREANEMMRKYVDIFVREAVARAAESHKEKKNKDGITAGGKGKSVQDDVWLDIEDLESITPGMLLDF
ncbi:MHF histone-fold complex subunit 1 [Elsinoe australis]|uniref:MHF histone-fold complex subunit 1 n=1 Tax=Elsinoe australis TaxID=40998 RepID=A0A2P7ZUU4_9PEZI|nr:MHF histone-fold complex subunit 1 [Elsinoe australis]